jgi:hypothetical protein
VLKETAGDGHAIATLEKSLFCDIAAFHGFALYRNLGKLLLELKLTLRGNYADSEHTIEPLLVGLMRQ